MSFGICQGMCWQHLHQPCVAGKVYAYVSLNAVDVPFSTQGLTLLGAD